MAVSWPRTARVAVSSLPETFSLFAICENEAIVLRLQRCGRQCTTRRLSSDFHSPPPRAPTSILNTSASRGVYVYLVSISSLTRYHIAEERTSWWSVCRASSWAQTPSHTPHGCFPFPVICSSRNGILFKLVCDKERPPKKK